MCQLNKHNKLHVIRAENSPCVLNCLACQQNMPLFQDLDQCCLAVAEQLNFKLRCYTLSVGAFPGITKKAMVYFSQETKQMWSANGSKQQQDAGAEAIDGGALWLPGNVVLELQMLPMVQPAPQSCSCC